MAEPARKPMTIAAFLDWDRDTDTLYELIAGTPVAMAPTNPAHQIIVVNLAGELRSALRDRPNCTARSEAGIILPRRNDAYYVADLAVTCVPHARDQVGTPEPILVVEVSSPTTENTDRKIKLPDYRTMPSVQEIMLVDSQRLYCEVHRRFDAQRWLVDLLRDADARLRLESVGLDLPIAEVYARVALEAD